MLKRALMTLLKWTVFIALVWMIVAGYWKYTDHVVTPRDLLVYFVMLPAGLLLTYFLARTVLAAATKKFAAAKAPATTASGSRTNDSTPQSPDLDSAPATYVLAHAISTYFGDESERFLQATLQEKMRVEIDAAFTQEFGYGVRVAGVDELELASPDEGARVTAMRTGALLKRIYVQLESLLVRTAPNSEKMYGRVNPVQGIHVHPEWRGDMQAPHGSDLPVATETRRASMPDRLVVHIVLPVFLIPTETGRIQTEVVCWLERSGWPTEALSVNTIQPEDEAAYFRFLQAWQRAPVLSDANDWLLILSATSWLDPDLLNDKLYKEPHFAEQMAKGDGVIGELACGMILTRTRPGADLELEPYTRLSVISSAQCSKPIDAKGTVESDLLNGMLAVQQSALPDPAQPFRGLVASGNLKNRRIIELGRWVTDSLPQLDFIDDILCVGEHIGECEPAGSLLALSLASAMVQAREGGVLFCANQHSDWRMLAALRPAT